jgi:hypothetical protein
VITKRTAIDQIEITGSGAVQIRFVKLLEEDGVALTEPQYHRTAVQPDGDPLAQMASVNTHLEAMGLAPVAETEVARIAAVHAAMTTLEQSPAYIAALATLAQKRAAPAPR